MSDKFCIHMSLFVGAFVRLIPYIFSISLSLLGLSALPGCEMFEGKKPPPLEYTLTTPYDRVQTIAVAPGVNLSPSKEFDVLVVSDHVYSELQQISGLNVLPVNKTLAIMQKMNIRSINSPAIAQEIAQALGADSLLIPIVTAYDPYNPPLISMSMQLYSTPNAGSSRSEKTTSPPHSDTFTPPSRTNMRNMTPSAPSAAIVAQPNAPETANGTTVNANAPATATLANVNEEPKGEISEARNQPVAQVAGVFNSTNQTVLSEMREFAQGRTIYKSALEERRFLADSDSYMRFVCHAMVRRLMEVERMRVAAR